MTSSGTNFANIPRRVFKIALWVLPLFALANVALLVSTLDGRSLSAVIVRWDLLLGAGLLVFVPWATNGLRLAIWCHFLKLRLAPAQIIRVVTGTIVANAVTPSATGGLPLKWAMLVAEGAPPDKANTLISFQVAEDSSSLLSLVLFGALAIGFGNIAAISQTLEIGSSGIYFTQAAAILLAVLLMILAFIVAAGRYGLLGSKAAQLILKAAIGCRKYFTAMVIDWRNLMRAGKGLALATTTLALVQWMARFSIAAIVIGAAGGQMRPILHWLLQWAVQSFGSIVPTPGGAGGVEAAFLLLFAPFLDADALLPAMTVWRLVFFYFPLTIAAIVLFMLRPGSRGEGISLPEK